MHRIDGPGATQDNRFTEGNPSTGVPATEVRAAWLNSVQEELAAVIEAAGIELDDSADDSQEQLLTALRQLFGGDATEEQRGLVALSTTEMAQELEDAETAITPETLGDALNAHVLGMGQTWQDVTDSRLQGTTYTNTTGRAIYIWVSSYAPGNQTTTIEIEVDGVVVAYQEVNHLTNGSVGAGCVVPSGSTYRVTRGSSDGASMRFWSELR